VIPCGLSRFWCQQADIKDKEDFGQHAAAADWRRLGQAGNAAFGRGDRGSLLLLLDRAERPPGVATAPVAGL